MSSRWLQSREDCKGEAEILVTVVCNYNSDENQNADLNQDSRKFAWKCQKLIPE